MGRVFLQVCHCSDMVKYLARLKSVLKLPLAPFQTHATEQVMGGGLGLMGSHTFFSFTLSRACLGLSSVKGQLHQRQLRSPIPNCEDYFTLKATDLGGEHFHEGLGNHKESEPQDWRGLVGVWLLETWRQE